tara:strand:- start:407 stop:682 length:276 start_codon:yes stop_codon:yes gene_type:complete
MTLDDEVKEAVIRFVETRGEPTRVNLFRNRYKFMVVGGDPVSLGPLVIEVNDILQRAGLIERNAAGTTYRVLTRVFKEVRPDVNYSGYELF